MSLDFIEAHVRESTVTTQAQLTAFSPAKINLYLKILGKRLDGFHELETVMLPLDFGDTLTFEPRPAGIELVCDDPRLPVDESNLVVRAAKLLGVPGARITLQKRTPLAAGLGGGSSNAASTLLALGKDESAVKLHSWAAKLGSDVNFFLGGGAALCRGRGEKIERVPCKLSAAVLLVNAGFGISTKWAYENWARSARKLTTKAPEVSLLLRGLAEDDLDAVSRALFNSLEAPAMAKFPVLQLLKNALRESGAAGALMSGSGATVFGLFADGQAARAAAQQIREQFGTSTWTQLARFSQS
jgi:4-diphosphocytidyl-2-C-methyl-D-erythritol kinase